MTDAVRAAYDARAREYAHVNLGELDRVHFDRERLEVFAGRVQRGRGVVADLGCGPGHIVDYLAGLGVPVVGFDVSTAMIDEARRSFPAREFRLGDLSALDVPDASLAGIVARYSLIHLEPDRLGGVFAEWGRALEPQAPVLVAFFAADSPELHGQAFDHVVVTAHALCPAAVTAQLERAGFQGCEVAMRDPLEGERPLRHATILARRGG